MEVLTQTYDDVTVVTVNGDVEGATYPTLQEVVLSVATPGCRLLMDMTNVGYMSSAGLRVLLLLHRQITSGKGKVILVGLNESLQDTMAATGFLKHFLLAPTLDEGFAGL